MKKCIRETMLWLLIAPWVIFGMGVASNQLVLIANHDKFPVMVNISRAQHGDIGSDGMIDNIHCLMTHDTRLNVLADIFDMHDYTMSIGDSLQSLGMWLWSFLPFIWVGLMARKLIA